MHRRHDLHVPRQARRVEDRALDADAPVVPAVGRADSRHATEADADAAGHRRFQRDMTGHVPALRPVSPARAASARDRSRRGARGGVVLLEQLRDEAVKPRLPSSLARWTSRRRRGSRRRRRPGPPCARRSRARRAAPRARRTDRRSRACPAVRGCERGTASGRCRRRPGRRGRPCRSGKPLPSGPQTSTRSPGRSAASRPVILPTTR